MWGLWPTLPEAQVTETRCQRSSWGTDRDQRRRPVEQRERPGMWERMRKVMEDLATPSGSKMQTHWPRQG